MTTPRSISSMLAPRARTAVAASALALALAVSMLSALGGCAVAPVPPQWKTCSDGTVCPIDAACYTDNQCLRCDAVRELASWTRCDGDGDVLCPTPAGCGGDHSDCLIDTCHADSCGDGIKVKALNEQCDDGNRTDGDGCDTNCTITECGNGIRTSGEECDDGNQDDGDDCDRSCKLEDGQALPI